MLFRSQGGSHRVDTGFGRERNLSREFILNFHENCINTGDKELLRKHEEGHSTCKENHDNIGNYSDGCYDGTGNGCTFQCPMDVRYLE